MSALGKPFLKQIRSKKIKKTENAVCQNVKMQFVHKNTNSEKEIWFRQKTRPRKKNYEWSGKTI